MALCLCVAHFSTGFAQEDLSRHEHTEIWMWGSPNVMNKSPGWEAVRVDAGDLWTPDAPWETVARAVTVIQVPPGNIERAKENDLQQMCADLKRRHLALAVCTGLLIRSDRCRAKTEAYVDRRTLEHLFDKLRRNGADVKYVSMDEPYYYGHKDSSPTACHESAQALAKALTYGIAVVRKYFPHAQIGTDEVITKDREWVDELVTWADTYQRVTGERLAYLHTDLTWKPGSVQNLVPLAKALKQRHVPLGIIYNADSANSLKNASDEDWARNTVGHFAEVESKVGVHPDHAVIETWVKHPSRVLPESESGTLTNVVLQYIQRASPITP